jgi:hypothetical protein
MEPKRTFGQEVKKAWKNIYPIQPEQTTAGRSLSPKATQP